MYLDNKFSLARALVLYIKCRDVLRKMYQDSVINPTIVVDLFTTPSYFGVEKPPDDRYVHNPPSKWQN
jgi:hypothetical protein